LAAYFENLLVRLVSLLDREGIVYMIIGGFALPQYGALRATADLDIAVEVKDDEAFGKFVRKANAAGFDLPVASYANPVSVLVERATGLEVEVWLRPDGIYWDEETVRRRERVRIGSARVYVVSAEDFIVSKLARPDRGVQDEKDVKSVLARLGKKIDGKYLEMRARRAGVSALLLAVERG